MVEIFIMEEISGIIIEGAVWAALKDGFSPGVRVGDVCIVGAEDDGEVLATSEYQPVGRWVEEFILCDGLEVSIFHELVPFGWRGMGVDVFFPAEIVNVPTVGEAIVI